MTKLLQTSDKQMQDYFTCKYSLVPIFPVPLVHIHADTDINTLHSSSVTTYIL